MIEDEEERKKREAEAVILAGTPGVPRRPATWYTDPSASYNGYWNTPLGAAGLAPQTFGAMQGMQGLGGLLGNSFGFVNALNSANKQAYNTTVAPIQMQRERNQMIAPLLAALLGGIGNLGQGMTGFSDTASRQMATLPSGSTAQPVPFR